MKPEDRGEGGREERGRLCVKMWMFGDWASNPAKWLKCSLWHSYSPIWSPALRTTGCVEYEFRRWPYRIWSERCLWPEMQFGHVGESIGGMTITNYRLTSSNSAWIWIRKIWTINLFWNEHILCMLWLIYTLIFLMFRFAGIQILIEYASPFSSNKQTCIFCFYSA